MTSASGKRRRVEKDHFNSHSVDDYRTGAEGQDQENGDKGGSNEGPSTGLTVCFDQLTADSIDGVHVTG